MSAPLDELYLAWLYRQVASDRLKNPSRTYWTLLRQLFTKEFIWIIPNDDNRVEDGRDLRIEFLEENGLYEVSSEWMELGCSFLEMLIALSRRLAFEADGSSVRWFWTLMENLNLSTYNDRTPIPLGEVDNILDTVIWRTYSPDGSGNLFPLKNATHNQQNVEIWYQLSAYVLEMD